MKNTFKEYHQFTEEEFAEMWKNCIFVFDTNTLLDFYRYSRETVAKYFQVLQTLKNNNQIWIPYQVGFEFYENRLGVISEYESSYKEILAILEKTNRDIENKYKKHPFLDLHEIKIEVTSALSGIEKKIRETQSKHPNWLDKDDVLENINNIFEGNIGAPYDEKKMNEIKEEGKKRYEKKIPPGFKDNSKPEDKKYGDLIIWNQIIDKAKEIKKAIIFVSGDVKEDWWLMNEGRKIMPLPQLKKEIYDRTKQKFQIYTSDRFLEQFFKSIKNNDEKTINEVREIREIEERKIQINKLKELIFQFNNLRRVLFNLIDQINSKNIPENLKIDLAKFNVILNELPTEEFAINFNIDKKHIILSKLNSLLFTLDAVLGTQEIQNDSRAYSEISKLRLSFYDWAISLSNFEVFYPL
ncbi:MAG: DUF4935 domain-containing protein [Leptospiraceae bacterium]|nr:DUF4935 domain-containing protein [Leptospiraceae bacterium]